MIENSIEKCRNHLEKAIQYLKKHQKEQDGKYSTQQNTHTKLTNGAFG